MKETEPILNTLVAAVSLIPYLEKHYDLPAPVECELIRRGFNDNYLVRAGTNQFVLRLYFNGKYYIQSEADFRFELDWLAFLHAEGIPVAYAIRREDGDLMGNIDTGSGRRWCALFAYASGERRKDLTPDEGHSLGHVVAHLHLTSSRFQSPRHRYHLNLKYLTEQPMRLIAEFLREHGKGDVRRFVARVAELERQVHRLPTTPEAYGLIHGDLHHGNFHVDAQSRATFFDFDHGGYGWRVYDLAAICKGGLSEESGSAFLEGYRSLRSLSAVEQECIPVFQKIRSIWDIGDVLAMRTAWGESEEIGAEFADRILKTFERLFGTETQ
jgi:Ser/Thr protein kinase RdoA (MazF antagonist)